VWLLTLVAGSVALPSCTQLTVVGRIVSVNDRGSNLIINLTDGTGDLEVCYWLQEDSEHVSELGWVRTWLRECNMPQQHMHLLLSHQSHCTTQASDAVGVCTAACGACWWPCSD
jgi:hypothetical protein